MKLNKKFITSGMVTAVTCALVGSITGTFAWYGYSTRGTAAVTGTVVKEAANLQLGIVGADEVGNLKKEGNIAWSNMGGGLNQSDIRAYLNSKGYASNKMRPTTSGQTEKTEQVVNPEFNPNLPISANNPYYIDETSNLDLTIREMPIYQYNALGEADKNDYIVLPLAIRVDNLEGGYRQNTNIYVSDVDFTELNGKNTNLAKAMRIDFRTWNTGNEAEAEHKILNVGTTEAEGTTSLGGLLDLNRDGYVDVDGVDYAYKQREELLYGAVKDNEIHKQMKNIRYTLTNEDATDNSFVMVQNGTSLVKTAVDVADGYDSTYVYIANPNYNSQEAGSKQYILATREFDTTVAKKSFETEDVPNKYYKKAQGKTFVYIDGDQTSTSKQFYVKESLGKVNEKVVNNPLGLNNYYLLLG